MELRGDCMGRGKRVRWVRLGVCAHIMKWMGEKGGGGVMGARKGDGLREHVKSKQMAMNVPAERRWTSNK